ncbi:sulfite exporter TauE/SafE family protein [Betaproteobacteria bacterium PRO4]|uniref:sulfite exporter TauE/SafE family protein n=1 Tax=Nitrosomonas sp. TaxID=42353 RepID=UPI00256E92D7|nr:sulfite exporter TauE/SafE family protein [Nitrosomonas sp.]MBE7527381.1 sulfite exporter TauE/SafE family protein [Burkholderiales bacterium]MDL1867244.1 sulfite exporter TauE/SafE family protein [Betaproteobacteria bacterium PRO4]
MEIQWLGILPGILTGLVLGLTGSGGAIIAVPLLVFGLQATIAEAAPVALLSVAVSAAVATYSAFMQRIVRYRAAVVIASTGMLIAPAGIWVARQLPDSLLTVLFSVVLAFAALYMFRQGKRAMLPEETAYPPCQLNLESGRLIWTIPCARGLLLSGVATGFLSGLLGVGGGFITIPALRKVSNLPMKSLMATALAITALVSATGVISATSMGFMNWPLALPFTTGTVAGTLAGRRYAHRFDETKLQHGFAILAWGISLVMIIKAAYAFYS